MYPGKQQRNNHQYKGLFSACKRILSLGAFCLLADRSATNMVNYVNAVKTDKVSFQIFEIDGPLQDIMWCGNTNEVILVQTDAGTIYRSRDRGDSWKKLHSYMHQTGMNVLDDGQTDIGHVKRMLQSPVDDSLVVFTGTNGINWVTEDCGANLRALNSGKKIHEFHFHPNQRQWALAAGWTSCADFNDDEPCEIYKELYVTKDLGQTWQFMKSYVFDFAWGVTKKSQSITFGLREIGKEKSETRIFITHDPDLKGHQKTRERWKESVHLYESNDFFKTMNKVLDGGNSIVMTQHYMFVAKAVSHEHVSIYVSRAHTQFLDFRRARLPKDFHMTKHFTVMDTSEEQVFLYVSDHGVADPVGHLFISDSLGYRFSHSMEHITKGGSAVDFETVESLDGTFLANRYDVQHGDPNVQQLEHAAGRLRPLTEEDIVQHEIQLDMKNRMSNDLPAANKRQMTQENSMKTTHDRLKDLADFESKIKTYCTHNKGFTWSLIDAPLKDIHGRSINCLQNEQCSLHLHMYSNNEHLFAPPYSQESAVGLVMAVGNHGQYLDGRKGAPVNTYLSRDGGYKWSQIAEIPLIYEFGDHGAILVAAPNTQSTTQIRYSWNEGKTWTKLKVSNDPIYIDNIIIEPKSTSQQFIIYGSYDNSTEGNKNGGESSEGGRQRGDDIMITLDFSGLHEPKCTGVDNPGTEKSDFELWSPHDDDRHSGHPNKCYLGQQVTYVRRKQDSECFNGEDFERQVMRVPCLCTERDYECDVNFIQDADGKCAPI